METIHCPYTEREAVEQILNLIIKYQNTPGWEIGIRNDGEIDAITDDSGRGFSPHYIAMRYFYTTTDESLDIPNGDCEARDYYLDTFTHDWRPRPDIYEIQFKRDS